VYTLLNSADMLSLRHDRLLELERSHFKTSLRLAEMDALGVPEDAPGRQQLARDLDTIELTLRWHRESLGFEPDSGPRVEPGPGSPTGDDEPTKPQPVGEEAPK
jgi:hypothetical protein